MKKFLKLFFSRLTLILLAILLQVAVTVFFIVAVQEYYRVISIVSTVIGVLTLLAIINRDMSSDAKFPWCILVAVAPIVGVVLYYCFSCNYASAKERKMFSKLPQIITAPQDCNVEQKYTGQMKYLNGLGNAVYAGTETEYFSCGEDFIGDFLAELEKAEKYIFMEYFIVAHGVMFGEILDILKRKVAEGVEVRLLYDDFGSLLYVKRNFRRKMQKLGIRCASFARLKPIVSAVYNNRDHRKITVIDGKTGYIGGLNIADEYINYTHPFRYWKDTVVKLRGNAVASLCSMFLQMYDMTTKKMDDFAKYMPEAVSEETDNGIVVPFGDGPRPIYNEQIGKNVYLGLIEQAERELYITTPYLIVDDGFSEALCRAAKRGVDVNVFIPGVPDKKSVYALTKQSCVKLVKSGVKIYKFTPGFLHAKSIVADGEAGVVGTINLDYRSFVHHYECGVYMYGTRALQQLHADLQALAGRCELQNTPPKRNILEKIVCVFANIFRPLM